MRSISRYITQVATQAALLILAKYVLSGIANVELVTLLIFVFAASGGFLRALPAVYIFCALDPLIYSFSVDVLVSYFLYYPFMCFVASVINMPKAKSAEINALASAACTLIFGVITTFFFYLFFTASFAATYIGGIPFFIVHIVSNFIIVLLLFSRLNRICTKYVFVK